MMWVNAYGCVTKVGANVGELWDFVTQPINSTTPVLKPLSSQRLQIQQDLQSSYQQALAQLSPTGLQQFQKSKNIGVILASTKGFIDDVIWSKNLDETGLNQDTLAPILKDFVAQTGLTPARSCVVSNACASSLAALYLANSWLKQSLVDQVLILAADASGAFVEKGFAALKVLTPDLTRPFSEQRSGFFLAGATAAIILAKQKDRLQIQVQGVAIDNEGYAVTRPSNSGDSLKRAILAALSQVGRPSDGELFAYELDFILAHGTATVVNDQTEDKVFTEVFAQDPAPPIVSASKWAVGHNLGVSGALDLILGCECMKRGQLFPIHTTEKIDPNFGFSYLHGHLLKHIRTNRFLLTSLGFGGTHAAAVIGRGV